MRLLPGTRFGHYEIHALIGAGGMGEVYRARDTKLNRDVALKVLPASVLEDRDRLRRLEREAQALAALNNPHIATIYGIEGDAEDRALILELVEGPTLAARLKRGAFTVKEAIAIARQVVDAIDAAHERGVVHRDLKPANIKLTGDGAVKVLDFGLARMGPDAAAAANVSDSQAVTAERTEAGMVLGTPGYMSPEQARGLSSDRSVDIWGFGCVLYETLTGRRAFPGDTSTDTLAAILDREPDWQALPRDTPAGLEHLLRRCLTKDPKRRLRDIGDAIDVLEEAAADISGATRPTPAVSPVRPAPTAWLLAGAAAVVLTTLVGAYAWRSYAVRDAAPARQVARLTTTFDAPDWLGLDRPTLAWSPDGSRLIYLERNDAGRQLYMRPIDEFGGRPILGTATAVVPFVAPDGARLGFFADGQLKILSFNGGTPVNVCPVANTPLGATWTASGTIVLGSINGSGLWRVPASGGAPQPLGRGPNAERQPAEAWPWALPDGESVVYTMMPSNGQPARLAVVSLSTGERTILTEGSAAQYVSTGHLVYLLGSSIMAVRFDAKRLQIRGAPARLLDNVQQDQATGAAQFAVSTSGHLAYLSRVRRFVARSLVLVDRRGQAAPVAPPARVYGNPRVSPDGRWIVVDVASTSGTDVWSYDLVRSTWNQLTFNGASGVPVWTPDGKHVTFAATIDGQSKLYWKSADGGGADELLSAEPGNPHSWAPDGRFLARTGGNLAGGGGSQIQLLSMEPGRETRPLLPTREGTEMAAPAISPNGRWIAYVANDSGRRQVYVRPFPQGEGRWLVSAAGGTQPMWARDGRELFYRDGDKMMMVRVAGGPSFNAEAATVLFEGNYEAPAVRANYDVMPDGQHFVMVKAVEEEETNRRVNIVLNWSEEIRRHVPDGGQ